MRGKKTVLNTIMSLVEELAAILCSFILPRLILKNFGSTYNGLITSITQFLACAVLLRSGIGGATRAALYKPIAENDKEKINSIMKSTDHFMKKVGLILAVLIIALAVFYPIFVRNEFSWLFTFSLIIIIGISTFAESFFGITYLIILQADQKLWVSSLFKTISYILNVTLSSILILKGFSIHIVKLGSTIAFVLYPIAQYIYVKKKYKLDIKNAKPNDEAISQRWDAFWHQVASFITMNTDVVVLTIFTNMTEVSVYSVYSLVINGLKRLVVSFSNGIEAAFGNMIAKKENSLLKTNVSLVEFIFYNLGTIVYTCAIILVFDFVTIYTKGINDANYLRPMFAYVLLISQFFSTIRIPYQLVVQAAGHYKQTKNGAIFECILNIGISVLLVIKYGLIGVAIGTLISILFRTLQYAIYMSDKILDRNKLVFIKKCLISVVEFIIIIFIYNKMNLFIPTNYIKWFIKSIIVGVLSVIIVFIGILLFYRKDFILLIKKMKNIFIKKGEQNG